MLTAIPRHWFSWDFTLTDGKRPLAEIDISWWREKGVLTISGKPYRVYREGALFGAFILESNGTVLARAEKPSAFSRRIFVECAGVRYVLKPSFLFSRRFQLLSGTTAVGTLSPNGLFSRRMNIDLSEDLPLPVRVFVVWLTIILWKRDSDASAAG
jgi:hypothetical protein